MHQWLIVYLHA